VILAALAAVSPVVTACGSTAGNVTHPDPSRWLSVDARARSATITLIAAYDAFASGYNIDGSVKGALRFTVPSGWRVTVRCVNNSTAYRYSCAMRKGAGTSVTLAAGAGKPHPPSGLRSGGASTFSFVAGAPGRYRLTAEESGVEPAGMWVGVGVTRGGRPQARWLR